MYHPYFRGKQFELASIRETAQLLSDAEFVPIVEPVNASLVPLKRTIQSCVDASGEIAVIINPEFGPHARNSTQIVQLLNTDFDEHEGVLAGILLTGDVTVRQARALIGLFQMRYIVFIHAGFPDADILIQLVGDEIFDAKHVFIEESCSQGYRRRFDRATQVLLRDGFVRMKNREYRRTQFFFRPASRL